MVNIVVVPNWYLWNLHVCTEMLMWMMLSQIVSKCKTLTSSMDLCNLKTKMGGMHSWNLNFCSLPAAEKIFFPFKWTGPWRSLTVETDLWLMQTTGTCPIQTNMPQFAHRKSPGWRQNGKPHFNNTSNTSSWNWRLSVNGCRQHRWNGTFDTLWQEPLLCCRFIVSGTWLWWESCAWNADTFLMVNLNVCCACKKLSGHRAVRFCAFANFPKQTVWGRNTSTKNENNWQKYKTTSQCFKIWHVSLPSTNVKLSLEDVKN